MQFRLCISCCLLLAVANVAIADDEAPAASLKQGDEELVIGDCYDLESVRGSVRRRGKGTLVKVNDKWLVLVLGVHSDMRFYIAWIPRDAAKVLLHAKHPKPVPIPTIEIEYPRSSGESDVLYYQAKSSQSRYVRVIGVKDDDLVLADEKIPLSSVLFVKTLEPVHEPYKLLSDEQGSGQRPGEPDNDDKRQDRDAKDDNE